MSSRAELSRFPSSSLFYFALVVVLGLVFYFTWQSLQNGGTSSDWHFSYLISQAQEGNVKILEINGTDGIATDTQGHKHNVVVQDTTGSPQWLTDLINTDHVDVFFDKNSSGSYLLHVLLPNIILAILIAAFIWSVLRQPRTGTNQPLSVPPPP